MSVKRPRPTFVSDEIEESNSKRTCQNSADVESMDKFSNFVNMRSSGSAKKKSLDKNVLQIRMVPDLQNEGSDEEDEYDDEMLVDPSYPSDLKRYRDDSPAVAPWWRTIQEAVLAIQESRATLHKTTQEDLYRCVQSFMGAESPKELYTRLEDLTEHFVRSKLGSLQKSSSDRLVFLHEIHSVWEKFCEQMKLICNIFLTLDRGYVLRNAQIMSIWDCALDLFRKHIMSEKMMETRTIDGLLLLIEKERSGETIDRSLVKSLLRMLSSLHLYSKVFLPKFLSSSEAMYNREGVRLVEEMTVLEYLKRVTARLDEENNRLLQYLESSCTRGPLIQIVVKQLLGEHSKTIVTKGLDHMLELNRKKDVKLMYNLLGRVKGGHQMLCEHFSLYIKTHGKLLVSVPEKDAVMVKELLSFKQRLNIIVVECCNNNEKYVHAVKESFESFINTRANKPAELIAKYIDSKLRAGNKESTEEEMEVILDKIMVLFRFINGKDVFEAFYKKDLAKRLLLGKSASVDAEKSMLSKLKAECGPNFTGKLEGMFKDMELSKDLMLTFKTHLNNTPHPPMELAVSVLTHGFWPTYPELQLKLPEEMERYKKIFTDFYSAKHSGRKLMWQGTLGHCVVKARFPSGQKELQVSLFQSLILLLFNDNTKPLTVSEIREETNIEENSLRRTLQSLACGKVRVLNKVPRGKEIQDADTFEFNSDFVNPLFRIRINQIQLKDTPEERKVTEERVFQDRQYTIDAAIVRIMKTRKSLSHNLLIAELLEHLKFPIKDPADMKKRIESLIDRDYMERDRDNSNMYIYIS